MSRRVLIKGLLWLLLTGVFLTSAAWPPETWAQEYIVGDNDVLKVSVYDHPDLSSVVRVTGQGTITLSLIGTIDVKGLTVSQVEQLIVRKYADGYIINPVVTVFVEEFRSRKITILGEVAKSGLYELSGEATLLEIISKAGGLTPDAGRRAIIKRRVVPTGGEQDAGLEKTIGIDLGRLVEEGDSRLNVPVLDGDSIYVPRAGYFFVTGEVGKPGSYKYQEDTTVLKAITTAGGFTSKASKSRVRIIRNDDGVDRTHRAEMDEIVRPDDVIDVPISFF